ncbi:hypothetical protein [Neorhodopirellula lusitana]|nr:hypothetical protein [Neorhodopirellula lusitana]
MERVTSPYDMMRKFGFQIVLSGLTQASEGLAHNLYDAGCTDTSVSSCRGVVAVRFLREAEALDLAILDACDQVRSAGYQVLRVELDFPQVQAISKEYAFSGDESHWN